MLWAPEHHGKPFDLVVAGEAEDWLPALGRVVRPEWLRMRKVRSDHELLEVVRHGEADAAVLDEDSPWDCDVLKLLRLVRQLDQKLPVVVVTQHQDRPWLEQALRLRAFSVVAKPLAFEEFVRQIHGIMVRLERALRQR